MTDLLLTIAIQGTSRPHLSLETRFEADDDGRYQDIDLAMALRGDSRGKFVEADVKKAVRSLKMPDRMRL